MDEEEPLSPSSRLFHEPHFNCNIVAMIGSGTRIDVDVLRAGLEVTLLRHPRFSSLQVFDEDGRGKARWVRTKVSLERHVIVPELDQSAVPHPDRFLEDYVSALSTTALDPSKPLWELHLLNLPTSDAAATAIFRIHHSLGDGASLVSLLLACTRRTSDPAALPSIPGGAPVPRRWISVSKGGLAGVFLKLVLLVRIAWNTAVDVALFLATVLFLRDTDTPIKGREGNELNPRRFLRRTFSLEDLKVVKRSMNVTLNDVLLGVFSAGLARYLFRRCGVMDSGCCFGGGRIRLRSTLLFNTRKSPGIHALADMMEGADMDAKWGNHLGYVLLPFPIVKYDNPLDYVIAVKKIADRKKSSLEAFFSFSCAKLILRIFGIKVAAAMSHRVLSNTTFSFSNVIGPAEEIGFYGHPIVYLAPTVYGHPHALTVHFISYMGKMMMALAVDETVIPDPHQLCEDILESINLIKAAAIVKGSSK